jgi:hypothetical protein
LLIGHSRDQDKPLHLLPDVSRRYKRSLHHGSDGGLQAGELEPKLSELVCECVLGGDLIEQRLWLQRS